MAGHPWTSIFGILGNIISFLVLLSPVPTFYRIYREKATEGFQSIPYLVVLFSSMVWLYYAFIKGNSTLLITVNSFGCVIEMVYIAIYIAYARGAARNSTIKLFLVMNLGLFSLIILITRIIPNAHTRNKVLGWICSTISVCVYAAPLCIVARVIRTKSVEFMPFYLSFFLTTNAVMWFCYGFFKKDWYIMIATIPGLVLGLCQMAVYGYFRNKEKLPQQAANMVNDVHPVTVEIPPPVDGGEARADEQQLEGATD